MKTEICRQIYHHRCMIQFRCPNTFLVPASARLQIRLVCDGLYWIRLANKHALDVPTSSSGAPFSSSECLSLPACPISTALVYTSFDVTRCIQISADSAPRATPVSTFTWHVWPVNLDQAGSHRNWTWLLPKLGRIIRQGMVIFQLSRLMMMPS